jgi:hypothetical protein
MIAKVHVALASMLVMGSLISCTPAPRDFTSGGNGGGGMGGGGAGGAGGSEPIPCPLDTHRCAVATPEGWSAPSAIVEGVPSPECPSNYPKQLVDARDDVAGAPAVCECSCGSPDIDCGDLVFLYRQGCGQPIGSEVAGPAKACLKSTPQQSGTSASFVEKPGPCPPLPMATTEPPTHQTAYRACGTDQIDGVCENNLVCIPEIVPPFRLCVVRDGEHPCPPGYPERAVHYSGVNDMRGCTECACTNAFEGRCESVIQPWEDSMCNFPKLGEVLTTDKNCIPSFGFYTYTVPIVAEPPTCTAGSVEPMGTVELSNPVTFCCATN